MGNRFNTRIEGTRIKHIMGPASVKWYDKFPIVLRIETTTYDVSFFEHYRKVEHRDGTRETKVAHVKKGIYSLVPHKDILSRANHRYLEFISTLDDNRVGSVNLNKISKNVVEKNHTYKGFNFFSDDDNSYDCPRRIQPPWLSKQRFKNQAPGKYYPYYLSHLKTTSRSRAH